MKDANGHIDPRDHLDQGKMSPLQIIIVIITVLLNAIDGFDVLSISFAAPGIAKEWSISPAALGVVMSMELIGMSIGSFLLGGMGDKLGRRPTLLLCLASMTAGMLLATTSANTIWLCVWRVIVGLGIGGILACNNAVVAEFSSVRRRALCVSIMVIGYPLGGTFGGMATAYLLQSHDWRSIFFLGATLTGILIPAVYFFVPESIHWLARKQPKHALAKINSALNRMNFPKVTALPRREAAADKKSIADIFSSHLLAPTLIMTAGYFLHITTFYFILKWSPKIVADMGYSPALAGEVLIWFTLCGAAGAAVFGGLTTRWDLKKLTIGILFLSAVFVAIFGRTSTDLAQIKMLAALAGFFANAGVSGFFSILAVAFPTHVRATGTGFVIGTGRGGAVLSPILAGFLFQSGATLPAVALVMGLGSLLAGRVLLFLKIKTH